MNWLINGWMELWWVWQGDNNIWPDNSDKCFSDQSDTESINFVPSNEALDNSAGVNVDFDARYCMFAETKNIEAHCNFSFSANIPQVRSTLQEIEFNSRFFPPNKHCSFFWKNNQ